MKLKIFLTFTFFFTCVFSSYAQEYNRVISLCPSVTKTIVSLESADKLVGISSFCKLKNQNIQQIGTIVHPNIEKILILNPDLIITESGINKPHILERLKELGLNVVVLKQSHSYEDIVNNFLYAAELLNKKNLGLNISNKINDQIKNIKNHCLLKNRSKQPGKIFIQLWDRPLITLGKNTYINDIISFSGGKNIFNTINRSYFKVSKEAVIAEDPDIILLLLEQEQSKQQQKQWPGKKVITMSLENIAYPCLVDFVKAIEEVGKQL